MEIKRFDNVQPLKRTSSANSVMPSKYSTRAEMMFWIVQKIRLCRGLPLMEADEARLMASAWQEVLSDIENGDLETAFKKAIQDYIDSSVPFGAPQIRGAWNSIQRERERREAEERRERAQQEMARQAERWEKPSAEPTPTFTLYEFLETEAGRALPDKARRLLCLASGRPYVPTPVESQKESESEGTAQGND